MQPLQLWIPLLAGSLGVPSTARDVQRAFAEWQGESTIYFLPGLRNVERWTDGEPPGGVLALPAEHVDRVDLYYVDEYGHFAGLGARARFPAAGLPRLLESWLSVGADGGVRFVPASDAVSLLIPVMAEGRIVRERGASGGHGPVAYRMTSLTLPVGPTMPLERVDIEAGTLTMVWPPDGYPAPVTIDGEAAGYGGFTQRAPVDGMAVAQNAVNPEEASLLITQVWPGVLEPLLPFGGGPDELFGPARMCEVLAKSRTEPALLLAEVRRLSAGYVTEGFATIFDSWFLPRFLALERPGIQNIVFEAEAAHGLVSDVSSTGELLQSGAWQQFLNRRVPIRRAWGVLGLFWALILEQIEAGRTFAQCERCHRLLSGKADKRYCAARDNAVCFRARRNADRQRERTRRP